MGASREGYDLFNRAGRRHFWRELRRGRIERLMWRDTFGRLSCALRGHKAFVADHVNGKEEWACSRCCKWIEKPN